MASLSENAQETPKETFHNDLAPNLPSAPAGATDIPGSEVARKLRHRQFVIDGEAHAAHDGISDFDALHSPPARRDSSSSTPSTSWCWIATTCAASFAIRKTRLARLLARCSEGIFIAPFEQGAIGPDLFRAACDMGLERADCPYRPAARKTG